MPRSSSESPARHFLVLGPTGSGRTTALELFSSFGFLQVGDIPFNELETVVQALLPKTGQAAFSTSASEETLKHPNDAFQSVTALLEAYPSLNILQLEAPPEALVQRYSDSGKKHPLEKDGLAGAFQQELPLYEPFKTFKSAYSDRYYAINTATTNREELRLKVAKILGADVEPANLTVYITSFGFKHGLPKEADLVFDMRFLKNPFYDPALRPLTGLDAPVRDYIFSLPEAKPFFEQWSQLIAMTLPHYLAEGKTRLSIAVGCTGGQHRSVCMSQALGDYLKQAYSRYNIVIAHRELANRPQQVPR